MEAHANRSELTRFNPGGESPSLIPTVPLVGSMTDDIVQSLDLSDLLRSLLDRQSFGVGNCANAQREGKGVEEEGLDRHGFEE